MNETARIKEKTKQEKKIKRDSSVFFFKDFFLLLTGRGGGMRGSEEKWVRGAAPPITANIQFSKRMNLKCPME